MSMIRAEAPEIGELTDDELSVVSGGGIGAFLTDLANDIRNILATGQAGGHHGGGLTERNAGVAGAPC
jgi:hypothetical protein